MPADGGKGGMGDEKMEEARMASKLESVLMEYNQMLTSTLEAQRTFYDGKVASHQSQWEAEKEEMRKLLKHKDEQMAVLQANIEKLNKEKKADDKKIALLSDKLKKAWEDTEFHKQLNTSLTENQNALHSEIAKGKDKDEQIRDLQDQVKDLMFFLEAQKTIEGSEESEEIKQGQLLVQESPVAARKKQRDKRLSQSK
mmetsp:Transcript_3265/g.5256  ORF Transcript_3265/g.5256 Transcript_3265/m.5256 type:complete len:198 (-) Transcript_3265:193-786(-)